MSSSEPTPEEQAKLDAEARLKEEEEQSQLPYKWTQTIGDLDITVPVPSNLKGRDLIVDFTRTHIKVGVKGQAPVIDVRYPSPLVPSSLLVSGVQKMPYSWLPVP